MDTEDNIIGGGSGGDTGMTDKGHQVKSARGTYQIGGNQVVLVSRKNIPPAPDGPSRIILLAAGGVPGAFIDDGTVDIRGCSGVRITSGPAAIPMLTPSTSFSGTDGVDIMVGEEQSITLQRGIIPEKDQYISMQQDTITINAGMAGTLILQAGTNSITITPMGITIIGLPMTQINPGPPAPPLPPLPEGEEYA